MKSKTEIKERIKMLKEYLEGNKECDGYCTEEEWYEEINTNYGKLTALEWVLKEKENK